MEILSKYNNGNTVVTIYTDGTKVRELPDDKVVVNHPESMDVKVTNNCLPTSDNPICSYCHEKSGPKGLHADLDKLAQVLSVLPAGVEIACVSGDSVVYNQDGAVEIRNLKVGDRIFDSNHNLVAVTGIKTSNKDCFELKCSKGYSVKASEDHPFMVNGEQITINSIVGKNIDILNQKSPSDNGDKFPVIDLAKYITKPSNKKNSRGGAFTDEKVRINHCSGWSDRYITVDNKLMWLYGLVVAEGSCKSIVLNRLETTLSELAALEYKNVFNNDCRTYVKNNSMAVEFNKASLYKTLFFDAMEIGKGARNKSIKYLFSIDDKELIRSALTGMFCGDGAFRKRHLKKSNTKSFVVTYKTSSKKLAYELVYLIRKHFGICASLHHGMNKQRKIEGRNLIPSDYYAVEISSKEDIVKLFPNLFSSDIDFIMLGNHKYSGRNTSDKTIKAKSVEKSQNETLYDITLETNSSHVFPINGYMLTHNCGGGNPLSHPNLIGFLRNIKAQGLIANMTINQKHLAGYKDMLLSMISERLIHGVGISYNDEKYLPDVEPILQASDNVVFHMIMGINAVEDVAVLHKFCGDRNKVAKVLVLGYKQYGFGINHYLKNPAIEDNKYWWYVKLASYFKRKDLVISFDNLAIDQMKLRRYFTDEAWNKFFMGREFTFSCYVDAVNQVYAGSSTSDNRVSFDEMGVVEYFKSYRNGS